MAEVDQVLPQTADPDKGRIHERKFVPHSQINQFVKWGNTGEAMFADAIKKFNF